MPSEGQVAHIHHPTSSCMIGGICHKYHFCCEKKKIDTFLSQLNVSYFATNVKLCLLNNVIYVYDKHFYFCRDKRRVLSRQNYVCRDKYLSPQKYACHHKSFVATSILLSRQNICRYKSFVATKDRFCLDKHVFVATKVLSRQK